MDTEATDDPDEEPIVTVVPTASQLFQQAVWPVCLVVAVSVYLVLDGPFTAVLPMLVIGALFVFLKLRETLRYADLMPDGRLVARMWTNGASSST